MAVDEDESKDKEEVVEVTGVTSRSEAGAGSSGSASGDLAAARLIVGWASLTSGPLAVEPPPREGEEVEEDVAVSCQGRLQRWERERLRRWWSRSRHRRCQ